MTRPLLVLLATVLLTGCAGKRIRMPGPVHHLAWEKGEEEPGPSATNAAARAEAIARLRHESESPSTERRGRRGHPDGEAIARQAARLVGKRNVVVAGESFRRDCSGFVAGVYSAGGVSLGGSSRDLYERAQQAGVLHKRKTPEIGDTAFFDDTYDKNGNGRRDDPLTHVAVVEAIADDGTIVLVHYGSKGVARITMDLRNPSTFYDDDGVLRNSILRTDGKGEKLTGELFVAWGSLWKLADQS